MLTRQPIIKAAAMVNSISTVMAPSYTRVTAIYTLLI